MRPKVPDGACLCLPSLGFVCVWCQRKAETPPETVEAMESFDDHFPENLRNNRLCGSTVDDNPPWNTDDLPEHLRGKGYRGADQDGFDGSEWVSPVEHHAGDLIEAARICLEAEII